MLSASMSVSARPSSDAGGGFTLSLPGSGVWH